MKKIIVLLLIFLCSFIVTGCKTLDEGTVYSKTYMPAHTGIYFIAMRIGKTTQLIPRHTHHPDRWEICVEFEKDKDCWDVPEEFYDSVEIGEYIYKKDF